MVSKNLKSIPLNPKEIFKYGYDKWIESKISSIKIYENYTHTHSEIVKAYKKEFLKNDDKKIRLLGICNFSMIQCLARSNQYNKIFEQKKFGNSSLENKIFKKYFENSFLNLTKRSQFIKLKNYIKKKINFFQNKKKISLMYSNEYIQKIFPKDEYIYIYEDNDLNFLKVNYNDPKYLEISNKINNIITHCKINLKSKNILRKLKKNFYLNYIFLKKKIKFENQFTFIPNSLSYSFQRALAIKKILDKNNFETFMHGNIFAGLYFFKTEQLLYSGFSIGKKINVAYNFEKKSLEKIYIKNKNFFAFKPEIKVNNKLKIKPIKQNMNNKKFLIVGFPMSLDIYASAPYINQFSMLKHELKIMNFCKKYNFQYDYKIHPDRIQELYDLYKSLDTKIIFGKLEDIFQKYSTVICPQPISTTFGYILKSKAKIITFDIKQLNWDYSFKKDTFRRTEMINTTIGRSNNLEFREKDLLDAIKRTSNKEYNKYKYKLKL